jgi:hypothetical protein
MAAVRTGVVADGIWLADRSASTYDIAGDITPTVVH